MAKVPAARGREGKIDPRGRVNEKPSAEVNSASQLVS
jgi:hypothetical protein